MRTKHPERHWGASGFTLVELMIVVAVIGILAAIAYPSFRSYVLRANRTDAVRTLTLDAQILQRCYSQNNFTFLGCTAVPALANSPNGYYSVAPDPLNPITATTFALIATAIGAQTADTTCASFKIDEKGTQSALNSAAADQTTACWGGN